MTPAFFIAIPLFFAGIHFLEYSAIMARLGGIEAKSHMLGYSIQQAVYVGTRCLIPRFDGVILSKEWKNAPWDKFVM